uniref:Uncharacterized protein n=1 Tax=Phytophthora fragariae TaxID=53985 RepID=A0A6A3DMX2_9STRA|nr:hypothetical protein PF009_g27068 [Phytophthora fragariae]
MHEQLHLIEFWVTFFSRNSVLWAKRLLLNISNGA